MNSYKFFFFLIIVYMNVLVDAKNEYTIRIINILSPLILEGLNSIYSKAKEVSCNENVLKIFQSFLKRIPKWNDEILSFEVNRIKTNCKNFELLYDLIRAALKANLLILVYSPNQVKTNIDSGFYKDLNFDKFIHEIYIECARDVWNNPYLFYHNYPPIEIKRNQRDTITLVKNCIEESIRKSLPLKHVLEIYLGDELVEPVPDDNFEKTLTEVDEKNLSLLTKKELEPSFIPQADIKQLTDMSQKGGNEFSNENTYSNNSKSIETKTKISSSSEKMIKKSSENKKSSTSDKKLNSKILNILDDEDLKLSEENNSTSDKKIANQKKLSETSSDDLISTNMDSQLKKILKDDLGNTDTDSSAQFKPENNSTKYQEIFSNSNAESVNSQEKSEKINKNKFFNNYLNF